MNKYVVVWQQKIPCSVTVLNAGLLQGNVGLNPEKQLEQASSKQRSSTHSALSKAIFGQ